jgi:TRAP-type C4-dicarboxylate transport system permease small subunit
VTTAQFIAKVNQIVLNPLIALMVAVAVLVFVWGVVEYVQGATDAKKRQDGAQHMFWGLIGFFIMITAATLIRIVLNTVGVDVNDQNTSLDNPKGFPGEAKDILVP